MSRRDKLLNRMRSSPGAIRFASVDALLRHEGFVSFNQRGIHCTYHRADGRVLTIVKPHGRRKTCSRTDIRKLTGGAGSMISTTHSYRDFVFTIEYRPQEPIYTVDFPDLPDIITSGDTLAEAFANTYEAVDLHLESLQKLGRRLPKPKHRLAVEAV